MAIANKARPATNIPVTAPDLKAISKPFAKPFLLASVVLTFARTEITIPTYPARPERVAPIKYPAATKGLNKIAIKTKTLHRQLLLFYTVYLSKLELLLELLPQFLAFYYFLDLNLKFVDLQVRHIRLQQFHK